MEEVLTGETAQDLATLRPRASELLQQLGLSDADDPATGPSSTEMAATVDRTLRLPDIAELLPRLTPEFRLYAAKAEGQNLTLTAGIADAVTIDGTGRVDVIVDWKSDVNPSQTEMGHYRDQVHDYVAAAGASRGIVVYMTPGRIDQST